VRVIEPEPGASRAVELQAIIALQRGELPFLVVRDVEDRQWLFLLELSEDRLWIGRGAACDIRIEWDEQASRCHAELVRIPGGWAVADDGLSRNGTFLADERLTGRHRLHDGDVITLALTTITYREPAGSALRTRPRKDVVLRPDVTLKQHQILVALCRPLLEGTNREPPATNAAIAREVFLGVPAIKAHLRVLCRKLGIDSLPQNQKRTALADRAVRSGLVSARDL